MDDTRTQQALDQLADLFLTGQTPTTTEAPSNKTQDDALDGPAPIKLSPKLVGSATPPRPTRPARRKPPATISDNALPDGFELQLDSSPLASIGEQRQTQPTQPQNTDQAPPGQDSDSPQEPPQPESSQQDSFQVAVEAVLLGNLPGLSGPWLTQYAQLLAQQEGPVVVMHVDDEVVDLELVEPNDGGPPERGVALRMPPGGGVLDPVAVLNSLMTSGEIVPSTILVRLDPQNDIDGLKKALAINDWTLMCGADDAAVVGGYWQLKNLVDQEASVAQKRVGLMIMGSDPQESQAAAKKIQSAAESFLETPVQLLGWQKQMVPVNLRHLGRFEDAGSQWHLLASWFQQHAVTEPAEVDPVDARVGEAQIQPPAEADPPVQDVVQEPVFDTPRPNPPKRTPPPARAPQDTPTRTAPAPKLTPEPESAPSVEPETVQAIQTPAASEPAHEVASLSRPSPPAHGSERCSLRASGNLDPNRNRGRYRNHSPHRGPSANLSLNRSHTYNRKHHSRTPGRTTRPDLVSIVTQDSGSIPGGIALEARCPLQPSTQLMLDDSGRLHLLYRHDSQVDGFEGLQPAMVDLMQARKWVAEHRALLAMTQRQLKFDPAADPVLHLFTDRAEWATALAIRLGEALKLHLLQAVQIEDRHGWFSTPLN